MFPRNSTCFVVLWIHSASSGFRLPGSNRLWLAFPCHSTNLSLRVECPNPGRGRFGLFPLRSPRLGESSFLSFPPGTSMFQVPGLPPCTYVFSTGSLDSTPVGFSYSEIRVSLTACVSARLFAAYRVLRRLLAPRHSPHALLFLTYTKF